jgi:hypothetical protein
MGFYNRAAVVTGPGSGAGRRRQIPRSNRLWKTGSIADIKDGKEYFDLNEQVGDILAAFAGPKAGCPGAAKPPHVGGGRFRGHARKAFVPKPPPGWMWFSSTTFPERGRRLALPSSRTAAAPSRRNACQTHLHAENGDSGIFLP